ncbi:MAG: hypothetical protein BV458_11740 [Thermoplasmata archaeon M9B2D]|nr:MAG: hypothetical protein BV458_11740 [Thermoplasmata archaeon M9B2D]
MSATPPRKMDFILIILLLIALYIVAAFLYGGQAWIVLEPETMVFGLGILVPLQATTAGIVLTYSLVKYKQGQQFRDLALVLISLNVLLGSFLYFLTNEALIGLSPLASRERNRTIVTAFSFILAPTLLVGSLAGEAPITRNQKYIALLWGGLITPFLNLWFLFSPSPVFATKPIGQGIEALNPLLMIVIVTVFLAMLASLIRTTKAFLKTRGRIDLALTLAVLLWFTAVVLFVFQTNPLQLIELVWYGIMLLGFAFIAGTMMVTAVIEPHEEMKRLVSMKTEQLEESEREAKFYLDLWSHKMGNLLQGMIMYLDLFSQPETDMDEAKKLHEIALKLSKDATLINRQVNILARIKETGELNKEQMHLQSALSDAMIITQALRGEGDLNISWSENIGSCYVIADDLLPSLFVNLFVFFTRTSNQVPLIVLSSFTQSGNDLILKFRYTGNRIPIETEHSLKENLKPSQNVLSLDLYSVKILMKRYDGDVSYRYENETRTNEVLLVFSTDKDASF